jgi:hypothetical protein
MIKVPYHLLPISELKCEDDHQRALISWSETPEALARYPMLRWLFAVPNGGKRSLKTASLLKQAGVKPGVPDLMLLCPTSEYQGLIIEMKYGRNKLSKEQEEFMIHHANLDYSCVVCWSWIEARDKIIKYLSYF